MLLKSVSFKTNRGNWQTQEIGGYRGVLCEPGVNVTNQGYVRFEIQFDAPTCVTGLTHKGQLVKYSLITSDGMIMKFKPTSNYDNDSCTTPSFASLREIQFTRAYVVFNTNRPMHLHFETLLCTVQLSSLGEVCHRLLEQDLVLVCSDGTTAVNSVLASATSGMIRTKLGGWTLGGSPEIKLPDYKLSDVEIVKRIMLTRIAYTKDISPNVVELMHYLQVEDKEKIWLLVRNIIDTANCVQYMCLADKFKNAPTRAAAETFFKNNAAKFIIHDTDALLAAVAPAAKQSTA